MTQKDLEAINEIKGTAGFRIIEYTIQQKIKELDSVSNIELQSQTAVGLQALAQKKAVKLLTSILEDLKFEVRPATKSNTYE